MFPEFECWYNLQLTKTADGLKKTYEEVQKDYDYWRNFVIIEHRLRRSKKNFYLGKIKSLKLKLNTLVILIWKSR